jgi:hypothetical protein
MPSRDSFVNCVKEQDSPAMASIDLDIAHLLQCHLWLLPMSTGILCGTFSYSSRLHTHTPDIEVDKAIVKAKEKLLGENAVISSSERNLEQEHVA